jgi:hypothetical protein
MSSSARGLEHLRRRLRIDEEVELGGRADVAGHRDGAAHDHDAAGPREPSRIPGERGGQIGERSEGHHGQLGAPPIDRVQNHFGGRSRLNGRERLGIARPPVRLDEPVEVPEPILAVDVAGGDQRAPERGFGPPGDRRHRVGGAHREDTAGVGGGPVDRYVAGDHGDRLDARLRRGQGEEDGQRVVDAGIGVDQEVAAH